MNAGVNDTLHERRLAKLNNGLFVKVCDATGDAIKENAGKQIICITGIVDL